jgi:hypothetical protein
MLQMEVDEVWRHGSVPLRIQRSKRMVSAAHRAPGKQGGERYQGSGVATRRVSRVGGADLLLVLEKTAEQPLKPAPAAAEGMPPGRNDEKLG